ncbi:MAG TPA: DUF47 family protein [Acidobacteriota bacterium]|jgi:predicted phosphate transport protein (TIGR00153 family)|nr:DUF47 family protein [Acidobacteriota bacterium]HNT17135.1 DUF47 family protein [Acidobacteriota bacterium]HPA27436.1 DUF47 family protein [Acidobacteriota bacterium]HQO20894.1 DUF47 family protein [Acidobacteriota bacterium]HQQ47360.1 DUF47 family protein [Acidobacteriota bacterium]
MGMFMMPKEEKFFDMFKETAKVTVRGAQQFKDLFDDYTEVAEKVQRLSEIEKEADGHTHRMVEALNKSFITPIDRDDIYELNSILDDLIDYMEACAVRLQLFKIDKTNAGMKRFASLIYQAVEDIQKAINTFPKMHGLMTITRDIKTIESEGDTLSHKLIADLFENEKDPIELIKLKEIYGRLESTLDRCQDLALLLEAISLKNG